MKTGKYDIKEMRAILKSMSGMYDIARVVDPVECRVLELGDDGSIRMEESCYGIWGSEQKCANCSSAKACHTGCHQEKCELYNNKFYFIHSNPVKLKLPDGGISDAVVEFVSIKSAPDGKEYNDRALENAGNDLSQYRAKYDRLTGILKADFFYEQAREMLTDNKYDSWKMIIGDIIDFRFFNSLFGEEKGNSILIKIADIFKEIANNGSGVCSRLYRDKFALLLPSEHYSDDLLAEAAKVINDEYSTSVYTVRFHFGIYDIKNRDIPISLMCERANMALRKIKKSFRTNIAYFDDTMMQRSIDEQKIISGFDEALAEGRIQMYLQPLIGDDGKPFGAEALARWICKDGSIMAPDVFIKTLEDAGMIHRLDMYIWEQAAKKLNTWKGTEKERLTISVNMSAKDFYSIDIYKVLTDLMKEYDIKNEKLRLEITESTLIDNPESIYPIISQLQEAGFVLEIDDFGKGQSSLSFLKDINADILKLDMYFLQETQNEERRIILKSVIEMAKALGMQVISEGVETEQQLVYLTAMGCNHFQGYLFSKPITAEEFDIKYA